MTDSEIRTYLKDNGYPGHVVRGGREGLVKRWNEFVGEVERGYEFGLEDYRNDLDIRGILRLIGAEAEAREADERLQPLLTETERRIWESAAGDPWWDFGYPRNAGRELRRDLKSAGLLE